MGVMQRIERDWTVQPDAERWLAGVLAAALADCPAGAAFADALLATCAVRLRDIVDSLRLPAPVLAAAEAAGWQAMPNAADAGLLENPDGFFPAVLPSADGRVALSFRVESIAQFQKVTGSMHGVEGDAFAPLRRTLAFVGSHSDLWAVERNGATVHHIEEVGAASIRTARLHLQRFRTRQRRFDDIAQGLVHTEALVDAAVRDIGPHRACDLWLKAEREYWMTRCPAGAWAKARQDAAGIGWANIDHHTYDGSREHFRVTVRILEKLGYELREMLYAGEMAGWGSQILEQPALKSTIFADVDLAPHEISVDFAHETLPPLDHHRRAGVLSVLHGESILEGGLNHVAGMYDNQCLRALWAGEGKRMMAPFSDFPFLYQELTEGDWAAVDPARVDALEAGGHLGATEAEAIRLNGAVAAHLENLERNAGYKGFNKPGIDGVLRQLDPRGAAA
jgi:hypothetical protein